jgi:hypothetical protein
MSKLALTAENATAIRAKWETQINAATGHPILEALVCEALPFVNAWLLSKGFPEIPTPAFCTTPAK